MIRSLSDADPFYSFRFCPCIGFDGQYVSACRVSIIPGTPWHDKGKVVIEALLNPPIVEFIKLQGPINLTVGIYKSSDVMGADGSPSGTIFLKDIKPVEARVTLTEFNAAENEVVTLSVEMDYDRLTFLFGNDILERIAAATA